MNLIIVKSANSAIRTITKGDGTKISFTEQTAAIECGEEFRARSRSNWKRTRSRIRRASTTWTRVLSGQQV